MNLVTKPLCQGSAAALGVFDGVHLGHRQVLSAAAACKEQGLLPCAFTFHSATLPMKHGKLFSYLYPEAQKLRLLEECGIQAVLNPPFSEVQAMNGAAFCWEILIGQLCAKEVFCGRDFRFGKGAAWGFEDLRRFGDAMGFAVYAVPPVEMGGEKVSSTRIRACLKAGRPEQAAELLGAPYTITGTVCHGKALGRTISFPTINLPFLQGQLVPAHGVYLSRNHTSAGSFWGVTNIGVKPTVSQANIPLAETHLLDFAGDLYGTDCSVELLHFLRPEQKFENMDALCCAIGQDCQKARQLAALIS